MTEHVSEAVQIVGRHFELRKKGNPAYSLRAFARDLGVSAGVLSEILSRKSPISLEVGRRLLPRLTLSSSERAVFLRAILPEEVEEFLPLPKSAVAYELIADTHFRIVADWEHFAILSLMRTDGFRSSPAWIAKRLGISELTVDSALFRLKRAGLIRVEKGKLKRCKDRITTSRDRSSQARRQGHRALLDQAIVALENLPATSRHITSTTFVMAPHRLQEARELINAFHYSLTEHLEDGPKTEVYNLNIQLVPVTGTDPKPYTQ